MVGLKTFLALLVFLAPCLAFSAYRHSPVSDEYGHLYAGLCYWQFGDLKTFNFNSPLICGLGSLPAHLGGRNF